MEDQREVTFQRALEFAKEYKLHKVFETSAKTGYNVEEVFAMVAKELYMQSKREAEAAQSANHTAPQDSGKQGGVTLGETSGTKGGKKGKKGGCC